jgi:PAS domain S-box-containing protein
MDNKIPHILIVDDDADLLATMSSILKMKGFEPATAQTEGAALAQLEEGNFDVALIDLRLGGASGLDVMSGIKARSPETECILLTGYATQDSAIKAIQLNAFGYFQKPFDMEQVLLSIQRAVEKSQSTRALRASEARYRSVIYSASDAIISSDSAGNIVGWNPGAERIFGYSEIEACGQPITQLLPSRRQKEHLAGMEHAQSGGEVYMVGKTAEVEGRRKDGSEFPLELSLSEWQFADEKFYTATIRDITERKRAEETLLLQSAALKAAANGIAITDKNGTIEWVNPAWSDLTGYSKEEAIGKNPRILKSGMQDQAFYKNLWDTILAGKPWRGDLVNRRKDGILYHEEEAITPVLDENGAVKNFIAIKHDITARKQAEEILARANLRLQSLRQIDHALLGANTNGESATVAALRHLAELVPCGKISVITLDEISDSATIIARVADENLSVSRINEPVVINDLRLKDMRDEEVWTATLESGELNHFEKRLYDAGGRVLVKAPLIVQGKLIGILLLSSADPDFFTGEHLEIIKDVSAQLALSLHQENLLNEIRHHTEQLEQRVQERTAEIETTRQRLELAVNAGKIGVWEMKIKEDKVLWDERMHEIHGTRPDNFDDTINAWWRLIRAEKPQEQTQFHSTQMQTGYFMGEHCIQRQDGSVRYIAANAIILYDKSKRPDRMIGVNVDVTDRKQAEEAMSRANLEMERALRIKDEFLANMSHELRTPLSAIIGISESLLEETVGALNEKQRKYISTVNESGAHLLALINDILDLSKIEAGRMELTITDVSVKSLFESSFRLVKEMAQKKNIAIQFEIDDHAQNMRGDPRRLLQMLVNLLSNAIKFTPAGGRAGARVAAHPNLNEIHFTVWDTGIGIAEEDIPRLFQSFVQLDSSLSRASSGTGLGLMLVMQMARMHGGNVSAQSTLNQGSCFTVTLPWSPPAQEDSAASEAAKADLSQPTGKTRAGNILLMEDTQSVIMLLSDYLQTRGHRVAVACDGLTGAMMAKDEPPDLILLDIQMPGMDGFEVIKKLRADESLKNTPVIALTALAMPGDRERCLAAGMNDYMSKPIHLGELTKLLERHLQKQ